MEELISTSRKITIAQVGPSGVAIGSGLLALALSVLFWPTVTYAIIIAHAGGHALTSSATGGRVDSIKVFRGGRHLTTCTHEGPLSKFATLLAGYLGPSTFGLLGAILLTEGRASATLWLSLFFLALALLNSDNWFGRMASLTIGVIIVAILRHTSTSGQNFFAYTWIWLLLYGGFGHVLALQNMRSAGEDTSSDAHELRTMTFLPASLWSGFFWLATLVALVYGAGLLLGVVHPGA